MQEAGDAPESYMTVRANDGEVMTDGGKVSLETGFSYEVIRELMNRGHRIGFDLGKLWWIPSHSLRCRK